MLSLTDTNTLNPPLVKSIISLHLIMAMLISRFVNSKLNSERCVCRTETGGVGGRTPLMAYYADICSKPCSTSFNKMWNKYDKILNGQDRS